jgi:hypothetical protein
MCVITAHGVQCLVAGCRRSGAGQQAVRPGRGVLHDTVVQHMEWMKVTETRPLFYVRHLPFLFCWGADKLIWGRR